VEFSFPEREVAYLVERSASGNLGTFKERSLMMQAKRHFGSTRKNHTGRQTLGAESLEKRELLAADWAGAGVSLGAGDGDGVCQTEPAIVDAGSCDPQLNELGNMVRMGGRWQNGDTDPVGPGWGDSVDSGNVSVAGQLTDAEIDGLIQLRQEEKLARDVYLALGEKWGAPIFENIAQSESRHMAAVEGLIVRYGLDDPITDDSPGSFGNEAFSSLYTTLVATGSQSLVDAYRVGAMIEEMDIHDLRSLAADVEHADIARVYENLERGSRNHLRAFDAQIEASGGNPYVAQYLDQLDYDAIADSPLERGNAQGGHGQPGRDGNHMLQDGLLGNSEQQTRNRTQDAEQCDDLQQSRDRDRMLQDRQVGDSPQQTSIRDRLFGNLGVGRGLGRV
jgi:hypothetical protein